MQDVEELKEPFLVVFWLGSVKVCTPFQNRSPWQHLENIFMKCYDVVCDIQKVLRCREYPAVHHINIVLACLDALNGLHSVNLGVAEVMAIFTVPQYWQCTWKHVWVYVNIIESVGAVMGMHTCSYTLPWASTNMPCQVYHSLKTTPRCQILSPTVALWVYLAPIFFIMLDELICAASMAWAWVVWIPSILISW